MEVRVIKEFATISLVEINEALARDNKARKRLGARVVFTYDGETAETAEPSESDALQSFLNSGASGNTYSVIVDLNRMKMPEGTQDRLAYAKTMLENKRLRFSTFVVSVEELCKGRKSEGTTVVNDGKTEMSSQSISYPDWKTTKEFAERAILRRFADRLKRGRLKLGPLDAKKETEAEAKEEDTNPLAGTQTDSDETDF